MSDSPQLKVDNDSPTYDLDGIGVAGFDDGSHMVQLKLGMGYDSHCIATTDRNLGVWTLMAAPSILVTRDEHQVIRQNVTFALAPVTFRVPDTVPTLQLIQPQAEQDIRLAEVSAWAEQDPFTWEIRLKFEDGRDLICDEKGWSLWGNPAEFRIDFEISSKDLEPRKRHEQTYAAGDFLEGVRPHFPYVLAVGQYSPDPKKSERCFLYYRASDHLVFIREAWLSPREIKRALGHENIIAGECDAMYMPQPELVWSASKGDFILYRKLKLLMRLSSAGLIVNRYPLKRRIFPRETITGVHVYLNHGWVECGVKVLFGERSLTLVRNFEWAASADPTYDGFNLLADTSWATSLGRTLSQTMGCAYTADKDLA